MIDIVLIIFLACFAVLSFKKMDWALMFILATLPSYLLRFDVLSLPMTVLEAMILIAFFVWIFSKTKLKDFFQGKYGVRGLVKERKNRLKYPFGVEVILLLIISFVAVAVAGFSTSALGIWKAYFFEPILLYILLLNNFSGKNGVSKIILSLTCSTLLVSGYAWIQQFTGMGIVNDFWANPENRRVVSFFGYPNAVGLMLAPILMLIFSFLYSLSFYKNKTKAILLALGLLFGVASIYFAKSEGAIIAIVFSLLFFGLCVHKYLRLISAGIILVAVFLGIFNTSLRDYSLEKATLMDISGQIRKQQWKETWEMLQDGRLFLGSGLSGYQQAVLPYHQEGIFVDDGDPMFRRKLVFGDDQYKRDHWQPTEVYLYPHNIFLNFWTELGFLGMLLFVWILFKAIYLGLKGFFKYESILALGVSCVFLTIIIHGLVDVPYFKNDLSVLFWVLIGLVSLINLEQRKKL